ncbi:MAG: glycine--tRNA ligase subunit beta [Candidatus Melainabacteria bacterium]|nr:glycine--tRNA ligase subunit beta [Candidatus Melainabacteria bacterium]
MLESSASSNTHCYLLEVGTEELPASFLSTAPEELQEKVQKFLAEAHLLSNKVSLQPEVTIYSTPRRLAIAIHHLPERQPDSLLMLKGPPVSVGLDANGTPTAAAHGFAKKNNISAEQLRPLTIEGTDYLVYEQQQPGRATPELLAEALPELVLSLTGSHFMRWGNTQARFSRPIRWIVSLWNEQHIPVSIEHIQSGTVSYGHRVLAGPSALSIPSASSYAQVLEQHGFVLVDPARRKAAILEALQQAAARLNGESRPDADLLETVTHLVEWPSVVVGHFDERYLELPPAVLSTVMAAHQKYFSIYKTNESSLLPNFLVVSNGKTAVAAETIRAGNERVLRARFEDARFFFEEDRKQTLEARVDALKGITFQKGLGSLYDKTQRLIPLAEAIANDLCRSDSALSAAIIDHAKRAALLSKTDLVTRMVYELTELQGEVGQRYAELDGEPEEVAQAIADHYFPRYSGAPSPTQPVSRALSLADKADTLVAVFSQQDAKLPTGSKDPLGLRRLGVGALVELMDTPLSWHRILEQAYQGLGTLAQCDWPTTQARCDSFLRQRMENALHWVGGLETTPHEIEAVMDAGNPFENLKQFYERLRKLSQLTATESFHKIYPAANRVDRILAGRTQPLDVLDNVDVSLLQHGSEHDLLNVLLAMRSQPPVHWSDPASVDQLLRNMEALSPWVNALFEHVMVNDPDVAVKANRVELLSVVNGYYYQLARFSKLIAPVELAEMATR